MTLIAELQRVGGLRGIGLNDVDALLLMDWRLLWDDLPTALRGEAQALFHFLKGMRHEFDEGFWNGDPDDDMGERIRQFTVKLERVYKHTTT